MDCPECGSKHIRKNRIKRGEQKHIYCNYRRQFIQDYEPSKTYNNKLKEDRNQQRRIRQRKGSSSCVNGQMT